jgi:hypothetical protein
VCLDEVCRRCARRHNDVEAAAELGASGYPDAESTLAESLLDPVSAGEVTARFESAR